MKKRTWLKRAFATLFLLLLVLNCYVFFTREWESSFSPTSYATLYYPLDIPTIREWHVVGRDRLQLNLACTAEVESWTITTNGKGSQTSQGMNPSFRIDTTFSVPTMYRLIPHPEGICQEIELTVRFYPTEFYSSLGMKHDDVYIVRANVPCGKFEQYTVDDWVDSYSYVGNEGLAAADRILRDEVGIVADDPTFVRMDKLTRFLKAKLKDTGGVPKDDERWMNPWILYNEMVAGTGKGWCTQNAQVWVFWANRAGIPTRFVFGARTQDNTIVYTGHAFAECYVREQNRWAFMDLQSGTIYVTDKNGLVLNSAELFHLNQHNAFDSTLARIYAGREWERFPGITRADTIATVPFSLCNSVVRDEFTPHSILKYRRPPNVEDVREIYTGFIRDRTFLVGNLERYLFRPQLAYSFYPTEGGDTYLLRRVLFFGMCAALLVWLSLVVIERRSRRRGGISRPASAGGASL